MLRYYKMKNNIIINDNNIIKIISVNTMIKILIKIEHINNNHHSKKNIIIFLFLFIFLIKIIYEIITSIIIRNINNSNVSFYQ